VKKQRLALLFACLLIIPAATASAQDFGIMESAETINQGNFKLRANPMFLFGKGFDSDVGVAAMLGYGFTPRFDLEGGVAIYDGATFFGGNGEYWVVKDAPIDFSITFGVHRLVSDGADYNGIDLTFLPGGHVSPKLEVYAGLDFAFEGLGVPGNYKTAHLVPGLEYKLNDSVDLLAELGLGLNDNSRHYFS
jgi:hypothetical protein